MSLGDVSLTCAAALVDALVGGGVRHACVSPGSRSTPLALALARDERVRVHIHLDERASAFFALGIAKATGGPVAVACTSGTATAELFPAVVEAERSRASLVLLTADRPPRLRGTGANQTIDQEGLYGRYTRAYVEPPVPATDRDAGSWRDAGERAVAAALGAPSGPVQVNCPFEEPLVPDGWSTAPSMARTVPPARPSDDVVATEDVRAFVERFAGTRGVITIGGLRPPATLALLSLGSILGWPVLAEPLSGLRLDASDAGRSLAAGRFLASDPDWLGRHRPEVVLQVGATPTTRASQALVAAARTVVVLDRDHPDPDPEGRAAARIAHDPEGFAAAVWDTYADARPAAADGWAGAWRTADLLARAAVDRLLDAWEEPFEGRIARDVAAFVPNGGAMFVGSSSPVRDLDAYMTPRRPPRIWGASDLVRFVANRGASGIDGSIATALGVAAAHPGPTYALLGDLTFLYDAGALLWSARRGLEAVLVVIRNGGGEIFSLLPQRDLPEHRELFVAPHDLDLGAICAAAGAGHERVERAGDVQPALERAARGGGVAVVEVIVDPDLNRARRDEIEEATRTVLARTP